MDSNEVIQRLRAAPNRKAISRATGVPYQTICNVVVGRSEDPASSTIDKLREYFEREQTRQ